MNAFIDELLYDYFEGEDSLDTLSNIINKQPYYRDYILHRLPTIMSYYNDFFPLRGIITEKNGFYYIKIDDNDNYINLLTELLSFIEYSYGYDKLIPNNYIPPLYPGYIELISSPSPIGTHISLGKKIKREWIGKYINFNLNLNKGIVSYLSLDNGQISSPFNPYLFPLRWYLIDILNLPKDLFTNYKFDPHITISVLAYKSNKYK